VLGIAVGNSVYPRIAAGSTRGVNFSKQSLLRLGIAQDRDVNRRRQLYLRCGRSNGG
jgi:hypothetical protein